MNYSDPNFVFFYLLAVTVLSIIYLLSSKNAYAFEISIIAISFYTFGYSVLPLFVYPPDYVWFIHNPPSSVSRITLFAYAICCVICIMRYWQSFKNLKILSAIVFLSSLFFIATFAYHYIVLDALLIVKKQITFTAIFCCFLGISGVSALKNSRISIILNNTNSAAIILPIMVLVVTIIAFFEVSCDLAPVKNMMRGKVELRASSSFHNPNWYALAVAPVIFIAAKAAYYGRIKYAFLMFSMCSLTFILSGSRSTIVIIATALFVLVLAIRWLRDVEAGSFQRLICTGLLGSITGALIGFLLSLCVGGMALENYIVLIKRVFLWPIYIFSDFSAQQSIAGRFLIHDDLIIDNAYIYWIQENTFSGLLLVLLMVWVLVFSISNYFRSRLFDDAMRLAVAIFVVLGGLVGQVYWAYPVWSIFSLCLGYVVQPIVKKYLQVGRPLPL